MNMISRVAAAFRRAPKAPPAEAEPPGGDALWIAGDSDRGAPFSTDEWRGSGLPEAHLPTRSATE